MEMEVLDEVSITTLNPQQIRCISATNPVYIRGKSGEFPLHIRCIFTGIQTALIYDTKHVHEVVVFEPE